MYCGPSGYFLNKPRKYGEAMCQWKIHRKFCVPTAHTATWVITLLSRMIKCNIDKGDINIKISYFILRYIY